MPKNEETENHTIEKVEVFAVGKWNGYKFAKEDLVAMANAFGNLREYLQPALKLGHNEEQALKDGDMALGWVDDLWVEQDDKGRDKLFAKFTGLPEVVYNAIKRRLYRKVSIELDFGVEHKGRHFSYVLTGVALLGAQLPAVSTLNDIAQYMGRAPMHASNHATFSLETKSGIIQQQEDTYMPLSEQEERELRDRLSKAESTASKAEQEKAKFEREAADAKKQADEIKAEQERREAQEKADKIKYNREQVKAKFEKAVTDLKLSPAQRDVFTKMLGVEDDDKMASVDLADVDNIIEANAVNKDFSQDKGKGSGTGGSDEYNDAGDYLHEQTLEYKAKHNVSYARAQEAVYQLHPKVAAEHINATTEQRQEG